MTEVRCGICDALMVPEGEDWKCPDCPSKGTFNSWSSEDDESHEDWKAAQSPKGTVKESESLRASRSDPSKEGER